MTSKRRMRRVVSATAVVALALGMATVEAPAAYAAPQISRLPLDTLGYDYAGLWSVNDAGQAVGGADSNYLTTGTAIYWSSATGLIALQGLGGQYSFAGDINNFGEIVGAAQDATGAIYPVRWASYTSAPQIIGNINGAGQSVNDLGQVVGSNFAGQSATQDLSPTAWTWSQGGSITQIPGTENRGTGWGINNNQAAVGEASPWEWEPGTLAHDLSPGIDGAAYNISDSGYIAGRSYNGPALRWRPNGSLELSSYANGEAFDVNNNGQAAFVDYGPYAAYVWEVDGTYTPLGPGAAWAISDRDPLTGREYVVGDDGTSAVVWSLTYPLATPTQQLQDLRAAVVQTVGLVGGGGLVAKLDVIATLIDRGVPLPANNQIDATENQIDALMQAGKLATKTGDSWLSQLDAIAAAL